MRIGTRISGFTIPLPNRPELHHANLRFGSASLLGRLSGPEAWERSRGMARISEDESALLRGICIDPDADLPRLVYADWLDEHGRSDRANLIRLQLCHPSVCSNLSRGEEVSRLLVVNREAWRRELPRWFWTWYDRNDPPEYIRGFVNHASVFASPFVRFGSHLLDRSPITSLRLFQAGKFGPDLARLRCLRRIRSLDLGGNPLGDAGVPALARSPHFRRLEQLDLDYCDIGDRGLRAIAESRTFPRLESLTLRGNRLTAGAVKSLAKSKNFANLRFLDLRWNPPLEWDAWRIEDWFEGKIRILI